MNKNLNTVIRANEKNYYLNFGMSAFINLEINSGINIETLLNTVEEVKGGEKNLASLYWLIKAGMDRATMKNTSQEEILDFLDDLEIQYGIEGAVDVLVKAVDKSMTSEKAKAQQEYYFKKQAHQKNKGKYNKTKKK